MNLGSILLWGFVATTLMTSALFSSQALGLTRMSLPFMLGTMFPVGRDRAKALGVLVHFVNGWLFALIYALIFESLGSATWWLGVWCGLMHGLFVLVVAMPFLPGMHPRMASDDHGPEPTRELEPPGFMALNYGRSTPVVTLFVHLIYGAILGGFYKLAQ